MKRKEVKMFQRIKNVFKDLYTYRYYYILRGSLLQWGIAIGGAKFLSLIFRIILIRSGVSGLTTDNIVSFLENPFTIILLIFYLFCLAFIIYMEFLFLVEILVSKDEKLPLTFRRIGQDIQSFLSSLSGFNLISFLLYLLLTIPVLNYLFSSTLIENLYIPNFITDEFLKTNTGEIGVFIFFFVIIYLNIRFIYTIPLLAFEKHKNFTKHMRRSWQLTKGKAIFSSLGFLAIGFIPIFCFVILALFYILLTNIIDFERLSLLVQLVLLTIAWGVFFASYLLFKLGAISYLLQEVHTDNVSHSSPRKVRKRKSFSSMIILLFVIGGVQFANQLRTNAEQSDLPKSSIAHRGYVSYGVENSLESLVAASKAGADYVELDLILSADNQFIVSHDNNLKRLTGTDITIRESRSKDILSLKTKQGDWTSHLVTFDTFVAKAKSLNMKLIVELKPIGTEPDNYVTLFVEKMKELGVENDYKVMSLDLPTIEKIEKEDSQLETGYLISLQFGNFTTTAVDFYAIEDFSYTEKLAQKAHQSNKKIYVWTINTENEIEQYLESSVDGIITDYPNLMSRKKSDSTQKDTFLQFLDLLR